MAFRLTERREFSLGEPDLPANRTESVERALSILSAFSLRKPRLSLAELASETGLPKSTILRLAGSLQLFGFIDRDKQGRFALGASVWHLGVIFQQGLASGEVIRPALRSLVELTGETASFFVQSGDDRLCLYRENNADLAPYGVEEGMRLRLESGASGLVLCRFWDKVADMAGMDGEPQTVDLEETRNPNIASISTPVYARTGRFCGALTLSGRNTRFDAAARKAAIPALEMTARELSGQIT